MNKLKLLLLDLQFPSFNIIVETHLNSIVKSIL